MLLIGRIEDIVRGLTEANSKHLSSINVVWIAEAVGGHNGLHCGAIEMGDAAQCVAGPYPVARARCGAARLDRRGRLHSRGGSWGTDAGNSERAARQDAGAGEAIGRHKVLDSGVVSDSDLR